MKNPRNCAVQNVIKLAAVLGLAAGCATTQTAKKAYDFFPPAPDEPHLQFLTAFSSEQEFRGSSDRSFMDYVTNQRQPVKEINKPYGVASFGHKFYICDTGYGAVLVADLKAKRLSMVAAAGQGALKLPLNLAVDDAGALYVADAERDQVVIFDKDENYVAAIGKVGEMKPRDVAVGKDKIYVADIKSHTVHVYDKGNRNPLFDIPGGPDATNIAKKLFLPTNLALDRQGRLYVADTGSSRVQIYDADGRFLRSVGGVGDYTGQFARVKGIAVDRDARLYAVDAMSQVCQLFDEQGKILTWFGEPGVSGRIQNLPAKVAVDYDDVDYFSKYVAPGFKVEYLVIVINQLGGHKVSVFGFGQNTR